MSDHPENDNFEIQNTKDYKHFEHDTNSLLHQLCDSMHEMESTVLNHPTFSRDMNQMIGDRSGNYDV